MAEVGAAESMGNEIWRRPDPAGPPNGNGAGPAAPGSTGIPEQRDPGTS
jgi:hypothetical protein